MINLLGQTHGIITMDSYIYIMLGMILIYF